LIASLTLRTINMANAHMPDEFYDSVAAEGKGDILSRREKEKGTFWYFALGCLREGKGDILEWR
jgi:hypothetical protein